MLSEFSAYHHETAFSEFLAYKTRIPVRGAIMLNEALDQVVLVKGWKKGANWSFPRGKINKDEKDLDCAVREVYEETGFDIKAAGLVGDEKDSKYIEVTMREQQMRLYVFRGVPIDTYFEPRTRKEISKIEWYKLSELPTYKKQKHQDGNGQDPALNAHKFYMVAPFLVPLKKWIAQQKKHDVLRGTYESRLAPTAILEDPATEDEPDLAEEQLVTQNTLTAHTPSDLPEVSISRFGEAQQDPSLHVKRMLNMNNGSTSQTAEPSSDMESSKSSSLLALLRNGSKGADTGLSQNPNLPITPLERYSQPPKMPQTPHHQHPQPPPFSRMPPPSSYPFPLGAEATLPSQQHQHQTNPQPYPWPTQPGYRPQQLQAPAQRESPFQYPGHVPSVQPSFPPENLSLPAHQATFTRQAQTTGGNLPLQPRGLAPYQRTGDPQFSTVPQFPNVYGPSVPPASRLPPPKLTNQSIALLNAFKSNLKNPNLPENQPGPSVNQRGAPTITKNDAVDPFSAMLQLPSQVPQSIDQSHIPKAKANFGNVAQSETPFTHRVSMDSSNSSDPPSEIPSSVGQVRSMQEQAQRSRPRSQHQENLLSLFRKPSLPTGDASTVTPVLDAAPVELSANPSPLPVREQNSVKIAKRPSPKLSKINTQTPGGPKPGLTSATVSGPLNQPQFDVITKSTNRRPSATSSTTEKAPKSRSPALTILSRPLDTAQVATEPHEPKTEMQTKPFQPQILRRPAQEIEPAALVSKQVPSVKAATIPSPINFDRRGSQTEPHKQNLLALFGKPAVTGRSPVSATNSPPAAASPRSTVSPLADTRIGATPPTRSRIGSLSSMVGAAPSAPTSTTSAADKKFLLDFLGGVARGGK
jgi:mRNA-decapping enzyme subunit 2